jgi:hypothetical protein
VVEEVVVVERPAEDRVEFRGFCEGGEADWLVVAVVEDVALFARSVPPTGFENREPLGPKAKPDEAVTITRARMRPAASPAPKRFPSISITSLRVGR